MKHLFIFLILLISVCMQAQQPAEFDVDVRINPLSGSGDRNVVADQNGILKIGAGQNALPENPSKGEIVYYDGTSWVPIPPGTDGQTLTLCNCVPTWGPCPPVNIGDTYAGGIVFYLDSNGGGLVAAPTDAGDVPWGCHPVEITGADGIAIGTGLQNTIDILAECSEPNIAAEICDDFVSGGFSDWYLPSIDELAEMYFNIGQGATGANNNIGGFSGQFYWSSTETYSGGSRVINFINGHGSTSVANITKTNSNIVRAIRAF